MLPKVNPAAICEPMADGAVLLHRESEIYFGLNPVGLRIWELLQESHDLSDLLGKLGSEYPGVEPAELRQDLLELLDSLLENGLVTGPAPAVSQSIEEDREADVDLALPAN